MDELNRFRDFRSEVAAPSQNAQRQASTRLARAIADEPTPGRRTLHLTGKRRYGALVLATLVGAALIALFISTPLHNSPGSLEKAEAALTPPAGTVLHMRWEWTWTSTDPACTVTRGPNEIWIEQQPPYRYRVLLHGLPLVPSVTDDPRALVCSAKETVSELGGTFDSGITFLFVPPNRLINSETHYVSSADPMKEVRDAIRAGSAHDEGKTLLGGRTVQRIRIDPPPRSNCRIPDCSRGPSYAYLDPESFQPIQEDSPNGVFNFPGSPVVWFHITTRYLTYEYLPRTAANVALTDIRAQHPNALP